MEKRIRESFLQQHVVVTEKGERMSVRMDARLALPGLERSLIAAPINVMTAIQGSMKRTISKPILATAALH
jgi:hypothetical protein